MAACVLLLLVGALVNLSRKIIGKSMPNTAEPRPASRAAPIM
jgi:hypothetical protein